MTLCYQRKTCRMCESTDLKVIMEFPATPAGGHFLKDKRNHEYFPMDLSLCLKCSLVQLRDVVSPDHLYRDYVYVTASSLGLQDHFAKYAEQVITKVKPVKGSLVAEIGSNDGSLLRCFKDQGFKVLGIEPAKVIAAQTNAAGLDTVSEFFSKHLAEEMRREKGPASLIAANNVIANIDDLKDLATGIRIMLSPDGVFVFETGYWRDTFKNSVIDNVYHEHLSYFTVKAAQNFFAQNGLELFDVTWVETKGGSIRGFVQLSGGPRPVQLSVAEMIDQENIMGLGLPETYIEFENRMKQVKKELLNFVNEERAKGKKVAAYGASVGVTTLLHYYDLGDKIDFLVDDNIQNHGLLSPGHLIPVLSPQTIYDKKTDYVVMFPWRYTEPILKKHGAFLKNGGHFVVPLPALRFI